MEAPKRVVLDTTIIVKHLRGRKDETRLVGKLQEISTVATTIVNSFEVYYGAYKSEDTAKNLASAKGFLSTLEVLDLNDDSAEIAGKIMADLESKGIALDPRDVLIGSIASKNGYSVVTLNSKHFERIPELQVIEPKEIRF
jgi:tRNA(fMet)-specific endonuclease VapC